MPQPEATDRLSSPDKRKWGPALDASIRREQFKLIYDYIKFHIGLYLGTPAVVGLLGRSFSVDTEPAFRWGLGIMISIFFVAGSHAAWFMGVHVNEPWNEGFLARFEDAAFSLKRRLLHHWMYWAGLVAGLGGLVTAVWTK